MSAIAASASPAAGRPTCRVPRRSPASASTSAPRASASARRSKARPLTTATPAPCCSASATASDSLEQRAQRGCRGLVEPGQRRAPHVARGELAHVERVVDDREVARAAVRRQPRGDLAPPPTATRRRRHVVQRQPVHAERLAQRVHRAPDPPVTREHDARVDRRQLARQPPREIRLDPADEPALHRRPVAMPVQHAVDDEEHDPHAAIVLTSAAVPTWFARAVLHVSDVAAAIAFYEQCLGFTRAWSYDEYGTPAVAQVQRDGGALILSRQWPDKVGKALMFISLDAGSPAAQTAARDALRTELERSGARITEASWGYRVLVAEDLDGNTLYFNYPDS